MKKHLVIYIVVFTLLITLASCESDGKDSYKAQNALQIEVLPQVELLTAVLAREDSLRIPYDKGNLYYQGLMGFFEDYTESEVYETCRKMIKSGFQYDAPLRYILQYKDIDDLRNEIDYGENTGNGRISDLEMKNLSSELYDLADRSDFQELFYNEHSVIYDEMISEAEELINYSSIEEFMCSLYGTLNNRLVVILAPGLFPYGGYSIETEVDGENIFYCVLTAKSISNEEIIFGGKEMSATVVHEWNHTYANPKVRDMLKKSDTSELEKVYEYAESDLHKYGYNTLEVFLDETIVRAMTSVFIHRYMSDEEFIKDMNNNQKYGFYMSEYAYQFTENCFEETEDMNMDEYIIELFDGLVNNYDRILSEFDSVSAK